ncbi:MAG: ribosome maturation factor RimM [Peptostreptococcales bacterium]
MKEQLNIGQIINVVGIKGELKVYHLTDYKERFEELNWLYIEDEKFEIERVRYQREIVILKLKGIDDRNTAEKYKDRYLKIDRQDARKLPEDTYFIVDIIGCKVLDEKDRLLGKVKDVLEYSAQDLYEVEMENKATFLIPAVGEFVKEVDVVEKVVKVSLPEGLIDV